MKVFLLLSVAVATVMAYDPRWQPTATNCNCGPRGADLTVDYSTGYSSEALCGAQCAATLGCASFAVWDSEALSAGFCRLFLNYQCNSDCSAPGNSAVGDSQSNQAYSLNSYTGWDDASTNCRCGTTLADYSTDKSSEALCAQACEDNAQCMSFGLWHTGAPGHCALFAGDCEPDCGGSQINVAGGYTNTVYNLGKRTYDYSAPTNCPAAVTDKCAGHSPCISLREDSMHHHLMWDNGDSTATVTYYNSDAPNTVGGTYTCTCTSGCSFGLVGVWDCPTFYSDVITITADYADDFTPARTNDHIDVCRMPEAVTTETCHPAASAKCESFPCIDLIEDTMHHHVMWLNADGTATATYYNSDVPSTVGGTYQCTCSGSCDELVGTWDCPTFYSGVITITADYANDFTPVRTTDHVKYCDAPTAAPTNAPTVVPTDAPTADPTNAPTDAPTSAPTTVKYNR